MKKRVCLIAGSLLFCSIVVMKCDSGTGPAAEAKPLEIVAPKGGEHYSVGQTVEVRWKINDVTNIGSVRVLLSLDNGKSYLPYDLATRSIAPPATSVSWEVTSDQVSDQCIIQVREYDDRSINDKSGAFSISE